MIKSSHSLTRSKILTQSSESTRPSYKQSRQPTQLPLVQNQKYARFFHDQLMGQKARRFIARIRKEKALNEGSFLAKKQALQKKRLEQMETREKERQEQKQLKMSRHRNLVLSKIQERAQQIKLRASHHTPKQNLSNEHTTQKFQNRQESAKKYKLKLQSPFAKRFKTIHNDPTLESITLPQVTEQIEQNETVRKSNRGNTSNHSEKNDNTKRQKLIYLPDNVRLKLLQINQKIDILNKMATPSEHEHEHS